jgi:predicted nucleic acid-binding protein
MRGVVFDSFAVLAWLRDEPGSDFVDALLAQVRDGTVWGGICAVNLGEVYYITARKRGQAQASKTLEHLLQLAWDVLPPSNDLVWAAARLKAAHRISYADAFALACAQQHGSELISGDPKLLAAPHGTTVRWETG